MPETTTRRSARRRSAVDDIGDDLDDSAWGQYRAMVADQGETPETALVQFSLLFGPVDGVKCVCDG